MSILKKCEICKKTRLWFLVKYREIKPNEFMPRVKSQKKMCGKCFKGVLNYNFKKPHGKV